MLQVCCMSECIRVSMQLNVCVYVFVSLNTHFKFDRILSDAFSSTLLLLPFWGRLFVCTVNRLRFVMLRSDMKRFNVFFEFNALATAQTEVEKRRRILKRFYDAVTS